MRRAVALVVLAACTGGPATGPTLTTVTTTSTSTTTTSTTTTTTLPPLPLEVRTEPAVPFTEHLLLDVHSPLSRGPWPIVVTVHGGAWELGHRSALTAFAELLAARGTVVFNAGHRSSAEGGGYPGSFGDVACAVSFARAHGPDHGGRRGPITLLGHSSGAHLAAVVALEDEGWDGDCRVERSGPPERLVGISGPYDLRAVAFFPTLHSFLGGSPEEAPEAWRGADPYARLGENPQLEVHLIHGLADGIVPPRSSDDFHRALVEAGYEADLTPVEGAGHFTLIDPRYEGSDVAATVTEPLR